jgi:hypothetical protein
LPSLVSTSSPIDELATLLVDDPLTLLAIGVERALAAHLAIRVPARELALAPAIDVRAALEHQAVWLALVEILARHPLHVRAVLRAVRARAEQHRPADPDRVGHRVGAGVAYQRGPANRYAAHAAAKRGEPTFRVVGSVDARPGVAELARALRVSARRSGIALVAGKARARDRDVARACAREQLLREHACGSIRGTATATGGEVYGAGVVAASTLRSARPRGCACRDEPRACLRSHANGGTISKLAWSAAPPVRVWPDRLSADRRHRRCDQQ